MSDLGFYISPWIASDLAALAREMEVEDVDVLYGTPLEETTASINWLEAALLAGHLPNFVGVVLAVRAHHMYYLEAILTCQLEGVDGDALGLTEMAAEYRKLIVLLEEGVAELELTRARILDSRRVRDARVNQRRLDDALLSRQRAANAQKRVELVTKDQRASDEADDRYRYS